MFITPEMLTQEFLYNGENFYDNADYMTVSDLDHFKIGKQVIRRRWTGTHWVLEGPMAIVGHRVHLENERVWYPNFDRLLFEEFERGNVISFRVAVQLGPDLGARYHFHSESDIESNNIHTMGEVSLDNCTSIPLPCILRPQTPPVKRMLTSVNLYRLAHGHSMLPKTVDEEELRAHYKAMKEKSDAHHA